MKTDVNFSLIKSKKSNIVKFLGHKDSRKFPPLLKTFNEYRFPKKTNAQYYATLKSASQHPFIIKLDLSMIQFATSTT